MTKTFDGLPDHGDWAIPSKSTTTGEQLLSAAINEAVRNEGKEVQAARLRVPNYAEREPMAGAIVSMTVKARKAKVGHHITYRYHGDVISPLAAHALMAGEVFRE